MSSIGKLMKQAQRMQQQMEEIQAAPAVSTSALADAALRDSRDGRCASIS